MAVNFQAFATRQGRRFEDDCEEAAKYAGWEITDTKVQLPAVEIDIIITGKRDISFYVTCKGSVRGSRPGLRRTDTIKKAVAEAYLMYRLGLGPVLIMGSPLPNNNDGRAKEMLKIVGRDVVYDVINPHNDGVRLEWLCRASEDMLNKDLVDYPVLWDLICTRRGC